MASFSSLRPTVPALILVAVAACGGRAPVEAVPTPVGHIHASEDAHVARARADSVQHPYTAADIHFMSAMIGHHAQALQIAHWAPTHQSSPGIQRLAERIINAQRDEIALMQRWLADRKQPVPQIDPKGMPHHGGHGADHGQMPGMLTEEQLGRLNQARGTEFDRLFLKFMIQHHRGAVTMVEQLFATSGAGQDETVFRLAADVNVDQVTEIARMEKMLVALVIEGQTP